MYLTNLQTFQRKVRDIPHQIPEVSRESESLQISRYKNTGSTFSMAIRRCNSVEGPQDNPKLLNGCKRVCLSVQQRKVGNWEIESQFAHMSYSESDQGICLLLLADVDG
jgi:hypothetical protein